MLAVLCYVCGYGIVCPSLVYAGLSLFIIGGRYVYMVVCVVYAYNLTRYQQELSYSNNYLIYTGEYGHVHKPHLSYAYACVREHS